MMNEYRFYDTSSLLLKANSLFKNNERVVISSITLEELENIKTSANKDSDIKYTARQLLKQLDTFREAYEIVIFTESMLNVIKEKDLSITNDMRILSCAVYYDTCVHPDETIFVTNDIALKAIANLFFGEDSIASVDEDTEDTYSGYKEITMTEEEMGEFYSNYNYNKYDLHINEYLIIYNTNGEIVDKLLWDGSHYRPISYETFDSQQFGKIKPLSNDVYQQLVADSFIHNQITMIKGPAGTGKSYLALGYLFYLLDKHKIDKIIVFCNTVAVRGAAKLGFYPGDKNEKLLDSQIGNLLSSKLGDRFAVEDMIEKGKLILLPLADARGYDTSGMKAGIYISEAQNMDINLMKLSLQRIGEDSICIIDGDDKTQVDDIAFAGNNNGMRRTSQIFRGHDIYGEVELKKIHRSKIAEIAELM